MGRSLQIALTVLVSTVTLAVGIGIWGAFGISRHVIVAVDHVGDAGTQLQTTMDVLDRPCNNGKASCGTLAKIDTTLNELDSAIIHADLVAGHEQQQLVTYDRYTAELMARVTGLADSLKKTSDALTGTATAATETLNEGKATIAKAQPLLDSLAATADASTATVKTFNGRLSDPRVDALMTHVASTTGHVDAVTDDLQKVVDKTTGDYLAPKPWWAKLPMVGNDLIRAGCLVTGRCP
jgi:hypothetical protein